MREHPALPFHRAGEIGQFAFAPRECTFDERDRVVRDIAEPGGGHFEGMLNDFFCLSGHGDAPG